MSAHIIDETGKTYGQLTVLRQADYMSKRGEAFWECQCSCGDIKNIKGTRLRKGVTQSCGCINKIRIGNFWRGDNHWITHGHSKGKKSPEYEAWTGMKRRCSNPNASHFDRYGGRGITVCPEWQHSFETFLASMGIKPGPKYSLDRIDSNGNYEPTNCRWATRSEQARNKNPWKGELQRLRGLVLAYQQKFGPLEAMSS
jgi:hypothetical protein